MEQTTLIAIIAIASFLLSASSLVWVGGFRFSALLHEVKAVKIHVEKLEITMEKRFEQVDARFEKLETKMDARTEKLDEKIGVVKNDLHKVDVRVTVVEQEIKKT